jgi:hypothetical protein
MLATIFKLSLLILAIWVAYAYLTGHPSRDFVSRTILQSGKLSRSRTTLIIWWGLIATGAIWLLFWIFKPA